MTIATCQRLLKHYEELSKTETKQPGVKDQAKRNFENMKAHLDLRNKRLKDAKK